MKLTRRTKPHDVAFPRFHPAYVIASWFWSGRLKPAPGTWGTAAALPFWWAVFQLGNFWLVIGTLIALLVLGAIAVEQVEKQAGRAQSHDAGVFVVDEVVGVGITLLPIALFGTVYFAPWIWWVVAFVLFRVFDVIKLFPAAQIDRHLHNGWGVMLDDMFAGIYAAMTLTTLLNAFSAWYFCTAMGDCIGTDGELLFFLLALGLPILTFFLLLLVGPWLVVKAARRLRH